MSFTTIVLSRAGVCVTGVQHLIDSIVPRTRLARAFIARAPGAYV
ncbi:hypothetical protein [Methylobacterium haplocladii]|nr:hypothetical protein [Methylobacterium haplocladii]GJD84018.1 hypothetical protein HPGCJGGD_1893 [Methylobacterium haplocladii]